MGEGDEKTETAEGLSQALKEALVRLGKEKKNLSTSIHTTDYGRRLKCYHASSRQFANEVAALILSVTGEEERRKFLQSVLFDLRFLGSSSSEEGIGILDGTDIIDIMLEITIAALSSEEKTTETKASAPVCGIASEVKGEVKDV